MNLLRCRVCGLSEEKGHSFPQYEAGEMMFGTHEKFSYFECPACGCLQIREIPSDLARHYSKDYYSLVKRREPVVTGFKYLLRRLRVWCCLNLPFNIDFLFNPFLGRVEFLHWIRQAGISAHQKILDVGSGSGALLLEMREHGFTNLTGLEPHISEPLIYKSFQVVNDSLESWSRLHGASYDLVMAHHSFEHMPNPAQAIENLSRLLKPKGILLIRVPLASSYAWKTYGTHWVSLDAPRHLYLHTPRSLEVLIKGNGLQSKKIEYDSTDFQFWGSIQYQQGIQLSSPRSYSVNRRVSIFSPSEIKAFRRQAAKLNDDEQGDSAAFYFEKN